MTWKMIFPNADKPADVPNATGIANGLKCAEDGCNGTLKLRWSNKVGSWFYGCSEWPNCNGVLPANKDGSPRGKPRTRELQGWRRKAHDSFDVLWKDGHCKRHVAYAWLREVMDMTKEEAHMFKMNIDQCKSVIANVDRLGPGTKYWEEWISRRSVDG